MPDNVDDIVADIAQEEKEEGLLVFVIFYLLSNREWEVIALIALCL